MLKPWESPAVQAAESAKYVPAQHVVVPTCDGLALFLCTGASRKLVAIYDQPDDLAGYFVSHFTEMQAACRQEQARLENLARDPLAGLDFGGIELEL